MELLQENLGMKIKKQRKRIKMDSGSEDDDDGEQGGRAGGSRDREMDDEELPDLHRRGDPEGRDGARSGAGGLAGEGDRGGDGSGYDSEDVNDFIVDEDGQPIKRDRRKKKHHIFEDSARQAAEDIFGVAFDYDEFDRYNDDEDYDSEDEEEEEMEEDEEGGAAPRPAKKKRGKKKKPSKTIFEMYEPHELAMRHFTEQDNEIRNTDVPERMQLRDPPVTSVPEGSDELEQEAEWIYQQAFLKPATSRQDGRRREDCRDWESKGSGVKEQIKVTLDFIRQQFHEVLFVAFYRKEYVPDLRINDLWRVYKVFKVILSCFLMQKCDCTLVFYVTVRRPLVQAGGQA